MRSRAKKLIRSPNAWLADKAHSSNLWIQERFGDYSEFRSSKRVSYSASLLVHILFACKQKAIARAKYRGGMESYSLAEANQVGTS